MVTATASRCPKLCSETPEAQKKWKLFNGRTRYNNINSSRQPWYDLVLRVPKQLFGLSLGRGCFHVLGDVINSVAQTATSDGGGPKQLQLHKIATGTSQSTLEPLKQRTRQNSSTARSETAQLHTYLGVYLSNTGWIFYNVKRLRICFTCVQQKYFINEIDIF